MRYEWVRLKSAEGFLVGMRSPVQIWGAAPAAVRLPDRPPSALGKELSYIQLPGLWDDAVLAGIAGDESLLHRPAQSDVEHQVDAVDCGSAESFALALSNLDSAVF